MELNEQQLNFLSRKVANILATDGNLLESFADSGWIQYQLYYGSDDLGDPISNQLWLTIGKDNRDNIYAIELRKGQVQVFDFEGSSLFTSHNIGEPYGIKPTRITRPQTTTEFIRGDIVQFKGRIKFKGVVIGDQDSNGVSPVIFVDKGKFETAFLKPDDEQVIGVIGHIHIDNIRTPRLSKFPQALAHSPGPKRSKNHAIVKPKDKMEVGGIYKITNPWGLKTDRGSAMIVVGKDSNGFRVTTNAGYKAYFSEEGYITYINDRRLAAPLSPEWANPVDGVVAIKKIGHVSLSSASRYDPTKLKNGDIISYEANGHKCIGIILTQFVWDYNAGKITNLDGEDHVFGPYVAFQDYPQQQISAGDIFKYARTPEERYLPGYRLLGVYGNVGKLLDDH